MPLFVYTFIGMLFIKQPNQIKPAYENYKRDRERKRGREREGDSDQPTPFSELVFLHDIVKKYHKVYM